MVVSSLESIDDIKKVLHGILDEVNDKCCKANPDADCYECKLNGTEECVAKKFDKDPVEYFKLIIGKNLLSLETAEVRNVSKSTTY